jgi:hypothetical protein
MSEAPDDAALEAQALAAIEGAEAAEAEPPAEEAKTADPGAQIRATAEKIGWAGKDQWNGDPNDWIDAPEFILKAAGEVLPSMRKSLEKANEEIAGLKAAVKTSIRHISKARQDGYEQRSRELQAELTQYAEAGDVENVKSVTADIVALEKQVREDGPEVEPAANPDFEAWKADNEWYEADPILKRRFDALCEEVMEEGYTKPKVGLKEATERLKAIFPDKFKPADARPATNPNRNGPAVVEGVTGARRPAGKSFSDMPREAQEACLDMVKLSNGKITKEAYVREHFAEMEKTK